MSSALARLRAKAASMPLPEGHPATVPQQQQQQPAPPALPKPAAPPKPVSITSAPQLYDPVALAKRRAEEEAKLVAAQAEAERAGEEAWEQRRKRTALGEPPGTAAAPPPPGLPGYMGASGGGGGGVGSGQPPEQVASPSVDGAPLPFAPKGKKPNLAKREAGGETWLDKTMEDWDPNDFRIFCGDLGKEVSEDVLRNAFAKYPSLQKVKVVKDYAGVSKGYGFISFRDPDDFVRSMREMNGKYVGNRPIKLSKSNWKDRIASAKKPKFTLNKNALVKAKGDAGITRASSHIISKT